MLTHPSAARNCINMLFLFPGNKASIVCVIQSPDVSHNRLFQYLNHKKEVIDWEFIPYALNDRRQWLHTSQGRDIPVLNMWCRDTNNADLPTFLNIWRDRARQGTITHTRTNNNRRQSSSSTIDYGLPNNTPNQPRNAPNTTSTTIQRWQPINRNNRSNQNKKNQNNNNQRNDTQ